MDKHILALLNNAVLWKKMGCTKFEAKHPDLVTSLLYHLILESQALRGSFLDEFWGNLGTCHLRLGENGRSLLLLFILIITSLFTQSKHSRLCWN
jgi:hypothetical protein